MAETMYDRIRDFALFKGSDERQISALVEKTKLKFEKYSDAEIIAGAGDSCSEIVFVVDGTVEAAYYSRMRKELICQQFGGG